MTRACFIIAWAIAAASCSDLDVPSPVCATPRRGCLFSLSAKPERDKADVEVAADAGSAGFQDVSTRVRLEAGELEGIEDGEVLSFQGVPYAAPPVGALRWRAPQPVAAWSGVRNADRGGPACAYKQFDGTIVGAEDCLKLNIVVPKRKAREPRPVMVWLHAGARRTHKGVPSESDGYHVAALRWVQRVQ